MTRLSRSDILARLRSKIASGTPIIGGGAGTGLSAKAEEAGGIDLIVIYNSDATAWQGGARSPGSWPTTTPTTS